MITKGQRVSVGRLLITFLVAAQTPAQTLAATLFIADGTVPAYRTFLADEQRQYPASYTLEGVSRPEGALVGFLAPDQHRDRPEDGSAPQEQERLRERLPDALPRLAELCARADIVVAIGREAARASRQECTIPMLAVMVTRLQAEQLLEIPSPAAASALYLEAEPWLNLDLIARLLPQAKTVGVFVSAHGAPWLPRMRAEAKRLHLRLEEIEVADDEEAVRTLRVRMGKLDAVLLSPETSIINAWSLKPILLMSARRRVPTFGGLTEEYVAAGVMAAVVSDLSRLHAQIATAIERLRKGIAVPPAYPKAGRSVINETVARAMSVDADRIDR